MTEDQERGETGQAPFVVRAPALLAILGELDEQLTELQNGAAERLSAVMNEWSLASRQVRDGALESAYRAGYGQGRDDEAAGRDLPEWFGEG